MPHKTVFTGTGDSDLDTCVLEPTFSLLQGGVWNFDYNVGITLDHFGDNGHYKNKSQWFEIGFRSPERRK